MVSCCEMSDGNPRCTVSGYQMNLLAPPQTLFGPSSRISPLLGFGSDEAGSSKAK
jgi:hypothetical protein